MPKSARGRGHGMQTGIRGISYSEGNVLWPWAEGAGGGQAPAPFEKISLPAAAPWQNLKNARPQGFCTAGEYLVFWGAGEIPPE